MGILSRNVCLVSDMTRKSVLPCLALIAVLPLHADDKVIEEVVVTATKRATTAQEVPFSLNVQTGNDIRRAGISNFEELSRNIRDLRSGRENDPDYFTRMRGKGVFADLVQKRFRNACRKLGLNNGRGELNTGLFEPPVLADRQQSLF